MTLNITIKHKLFVFSLLALSGVAGSGYLGNRELTDAKTEITTNFLALKNHLHADMMHDAIRADVLSALYASKNGNTEQHQNAATELKGHVKEIRQTLQMNAELALNDDIKNALEQVKPALESYVTGADAIVSAASKDHAAAAAQLPVFMQSFLTLEKDMATLSDFIEKNTLQSQQQGEIAAEYSINLLITTSLASFVVLLFSYYFLSKGDEIRRFNAILEERVLQRTEELHSQHEEILRLNASLEERVQHRTADLVASNAQAQLLLIQLQQRNDESNMLVYSFSHDLRSPLINLQGFSNEIVAVSKNLRGLITSGGVPAEIQKRGLGLIDSDMRESIHFIQAGVTRLSNIIDAMLRLARAGRVEYHWTEVATGLVVKRIVDSMQAVATERGAAITASDLPPVWGDATALDQIFANLIGNALNYLDPKRPGLIEIGWQPDADTNSSMASMHTYYVRDNGLGLSQAAKGKLFQIFQRFHPDQAKGEGVGLSIVRRMVERHSGKIWVESREGEGSTFFISLPIQAWQAAA